MKLAPKALTFIVLFLPCLLTAAPLEEESSKFLADIFRRLRQSSQDPNSVEQQYRQAVVNASQALRAYYGVNLEVFTVFGVELKRDQASAQVHNALYILNQKRRDLLKQNDRGFLDVRLFELNKDAIDSAFLEILTYQKDRVSSGVYEALTQGTLSAMLSDIRVDVAMVRAAVLLDLPQDKKALFEAEKTHYLELYKKLVQLVSSDIRSRQAFEAMTGEKYSSLFHERDVYLDGPPLTHPFGRCQVIF